MQIRHSNAARDDLRRQEKYSTRRIDRMLAQYAELAIILILLILIGILLHQKHQVIKTNNQKWVHELNKRGIMKGHHFVK